MNIDMNETRSLATADELRARVVYALKLAVIAGVILACSESSSPASSQEAPEIKQVTGSDADRFADALADIGYKDVKLVALAYGDSDRETLIVLQLASGGRAQGSFEVGEFLIPPVGQTFTEAVVLYTGSPGSTTTCGRPEGGNRPCKCLVLSGTPIGC